MSYHSCVIVQRSSSQEGIIARRNGLPPAERLDLNSTKGSRDAGAKANRTQAWGLRYDPVRPPCLGALPALSSAHAHVYEGSLQAASLHIITEMETDVAG